jgi:hypothetical protein
MPAISDEEIDKLLSRQAIHDLLMAYARGVDRADAGLLESIFHPDATVATGVIDGTGSEFARAIVDHVRKRLDSCFHAIANQWVQVCGDRAVGESYVIAITTAGAEEGVIAGRYIDEFERRDGVWKIRSHIIVMDWSKTRPAGSADDGMFRAIKTRGCYGRSDPVYQYWRDPSPVT